MAAVDDIDEVVERLQLALGEFVKRNPEPMKKLFSIEKTLVSQTPWPPGRGGGLLRSWSVRHRISELARSLASRS